MSITRLTTNGLTGTKYDTVSADNYYMEPIATTLLGSSASSITFSNIPQNYKHLQIRGILRSTAASASANTFITYNGDTGNNYATHILRGDGASVTSAAYITSYGYMYGPEISASTATAGIFGTAVIDILDYANVYKYKTLRMLQGNDRNGSGNMSFQSGLWLNTAAVTSISFTTSGSFATNSRFSLYGIKG